MSKNPHLPIYCINLKRCTERRETFYKRWIEGLGYTVEFFDAVDKNDITTEEIERAEKEISKLPYSPYYLFEGGYSLSGVMACSKSHLKLLKSLKDEVGEQGVVIMEDDVIPLEGADQLQERIELAKKHFPNVQNIICNDYDKKQAMYGPQFVLTAIEKKYFSWDEAKHSVTIPNAKASLVRMSPPGSYFRWYSKQGVLNMIKYMEGKEFYPIPVFYTEFAKARTLLILTPGLGTHCFEVKSEVNVPPYHFFNSSTNPIYI